VVLSFLFSFFFYENVFADVSYSACDNTDTTQSGNTTISFNCRGGGTLPSPMTVYAVELNISNVGSGNMYYQSPESLTTTSCYAQPRPTATGIQIIELTTPLDFDTGAGNMDVNFYNNPSCTIATDVLTYYIGASPFNYHVWYWSPLVPPNTIPRIISHTETATTSPTVLFEADVYNDSAEEVCWFLANNDTGSIETFCSDLFSSGETGVSFYKTVDDGYYTGTVSMRGGGTTATSTLQVTFISGETGFEIGGSNFLPISTTTESNAFLSGIQRIFVNQDTPILFNQAISELKYNLGQKIPFGFWYSFEENYRLMLLGNGTMSDLVVNITSIGGSTGVFIWEDAKDEFNILFPDNIKDTVGELLWFLVYMEIVILVFWLLKK